MPSPLMFLWVCGFWNLSPSLAQQPNLRTVRTAQRSRTSLHLAQSLERSVLRMGSQGTQVSDVQAVLKLLGYYKGAISGRYDESTVIAVFLFQQAAELKTSGIVDLATWERLFPTTANPNPSSPEAPFPSPTATQPRPTPTATATTSRPSAPTRPTLRLGMRGTAVRELQERLQALGFTVGTADGVFGDATLRAVIAAQNKFKLNPDGVVGPATWRALLGR